MQQLNVNHHVVSFTFYILYMTFSFTITSLPLLLYFYNIQRMQCFMVLQHSTKIYVHGKTTTPCSPPLQHPFVLVLFLADCLLVLGRSTVSGKTNWLCFILVCDAVRNNKILKNDDFRIEESQNINTCSLASHAIQIYLKAVYILWYKKYEYILYIMDNWSKLK